MTFATGALIKALDRAQDPRAVKAIVWALERVTGFSSKAVAVSLNGQPSDWYTREGYHRIAGFLGAQSSYSGKTVTPETALESAAVYACVKILSQDMGSLPFFTYQRSADRKSTEKAYDHPLYRLLHDLPNPEVGAGEFVEMLTAHAALGMDGFARIDRTASGITYLWPLMPQDISTDRNSRGRLVYVWKHGTSQEKTYNREDIFHLRGFMLGGVRGDDILRRARHPLGLTLAEDEYVSRFFENDATPGLVISRPVGQASLSPDGIQNLKKQWKLWHQGASRSHEPAVLQEGMTATALTPDHDKIQLIEQRKFQILEVCRLFTMPPHKLAELDRATWSNIEQSQIEYVQHTLASWIRRWRQAVYRCLLTRDEQQANQIYAEHDVSALLRGDFQAQSEGFRKLLEKGVYSINDVRRWLNLNPIAGGDEHLVQLNLSTVQAIADGLNLPDNSGVRVVGAQKEGSA